jgi:hypothetical protein
MLRGALLTLLLDPRYAGGGGEGARPAILPPNQIALGVFLEDFLDDPRATGLSGPLGLHDNAVSDLSLQSRPPGFRCCEPSAPDLRLWTRKRCAGGVADARVGRLATVDAEGRPVTPSRGGLYGGFRARRP